MDSIQATTTAVSAVAKTNLHPSIKRKSSVNIMKTNLISNAVRSALVAIFFIGSLAVSGCSADAIMGADQADAVSMDTRSIPHGQHPGNDDCSVGGCE